MFEFVVDAIFERFAEQHIVLFGKVGVFCVEFGDRVTKILPDFTWVCEVYFLAVDVDAWSGWVFILVGLLFVGGMSFMVGVNRLWGLFELMRLKERFASLLLGLVVVCSVFLCLVWVDAVGGGLTILFLVWMMRFGVL